MAVLSLLKCTKGGIQIEAVLDMDRVEFDDWMRAAVDLERRIADSMKE